MMPPLRSRLVLLFTLLAVGAGLAGQNDAAEAPRRHRIGVFFWHDSPNDRATFRGIREGLGQAGLAVDFVEHQADSDPRRAEAALRSLRDADCDLVFAMGTQAALLAKQALTKTPVVFAAVSDPVASGVVPSWEGSDQDNLCGASNWIAPRNVIDVFCLAVPGLGRLGMLRSGDAGVVSRAELATMLGWLEQDAEHRVELVEAIAADADDIGRAVAELLAANVDAIWVPIDITIYRHLPAVRTAVGKRRVPLLTTAAAGVDAGAVVGTIADYPLHGRRAAMLAVEVLHRGRRPRDLAVDRMTGSLVVANLGAARELGLELPLSLLVLADRLVDPKEPR